MKKLIFKMMISLGCPISYYFKTQQAVQWWQERQALSLLRETEKIRDGLLQESFIIRRVLENYLRENGEERAEVNLDWLKKFEDFYFSLEELNIRLFPPYIEDSFPLAIHSMIQSWERDCPHLTVSMDLQTNWRQESLDRNLIIFKTLEELLYISTSELLAELHIQIILKQNQRFGELIVYISCNDISNLNLYWKKKDLDYLSQTFEFLTSGLCDRSKDKHKISWRFYWPTILA